MSSLLNSYQSDFFITLEQVKVLLEGAKYEPLPQRNNILKQIEQQKDELFDLIDQMDIEVNNSIRDISERAGYKSKLRDYKKQIQQEIKIPLQGLIDNENRDSLFKGVKIDNDEQRQQLLSNHMLLERTGDRLKDATKLAIETEGIGSQIMVDLRSQRETLENARKTLFQADSHVDRSIRTLKTMSRRLVANKFISYAIIAVLIILIILVLFSKFR